MYVCVCHALTDRQIRQHATVAESIAALYRALGVRPACGKCVPLGANHSGWLSASTG